MATLGLARADDTELLPVAGGLVETTLDDVDLGALYGGRLAKKRG